MFDQVYRRSVATDATWHIMLSNVETGYRFVMTGKERGSQCLSLRMLQVDGCTLSYSVSAHVSLGSFRGASVAVLHSCRQYGLR